MTQLDPIALEAAAELEAMAVRIDNDGTASQIVTAEELRELAAALRRPIEEPKPGVREAALEEAAKWHDDAATQLLATAGEQRLAGRENMPLPPLTPEDTSHG